MIVVAKSLEFAVNAQRTCLQRRFFDHFAFDSNVELIAAVERMECDVDSVACSRDLRVGVYSGWMYWYLFLKGFLQFRAAESLRDDNVYLDYFLRHYLPRAHDPGLALEAANVDAARARVINRYARMLMLAEMNDAGVTAVTEIDPIVVDVTDPPPADPLRVFAVGAADSIGAARVDGWHRLFAARLFGIASIPGMVRYAISVSSA
ncbi:MAG: hypothetical protein M3161_02685 [Actinomycetota bacterium]|nr:hypothetical protein [Actinomycetota bacterium]